MENQRLDNETDFGLYKSLEDKSVRLSDYNYMRRQIGMDAYFMFLDHFVPSANCDDGGVCHTVHDRPGTTPSHFADTDTHFIRRRNERERERVRCVNEGYERLKQHLPPEVKVQRRLSKVETLRKAIKYIRKLQQLLQDAEIHTTTSMETVV
ncbi:unnamed protein product [Lymnaea stagnalis]|uniref:BHLH domain-containing protein n=1 Tax=Lymnaea stagnalis TaxID=6523 RepID=A0AAV2I3X9_LYMST